MGGESTQPATARMSDEEQYEDDFEDDGEEEPTETCVRTLPPAHAAIPFALPRLLACTALFGACLLSVNLVPSAARCSDAVREG